MRAAHYAGEGSITVDDVALDAPEPGHVQLDVAYTGICGTDLHVLHGAMDQRVTIPAVLGHEMSGRIAALGNGVEGWNLGDAVTVMPLRWCNACPACKAGHSHICQNLDFVGIDSPGAMQNRWDIPAGILVRLPDGLDLRHAALVEPVAVAVHDVRRSGLVAGERALVVGCGPIGLLIACVARAAGADVLIAEIDPHRRMVAERLGIRTIDSASETVAAVVSEWTGGAGSPLAFEVSGSQPGLDLAIDQLGARGRLVVVAIHPAPRPVSLHRVFWRELTLIGARVYERTDFERAVDLVHSGSIPADALISLVVPLDEAARGFAALQGGGGVLKVLIDCSATP